MRYYLSLNQTWDAGDTLLSGTRPVSALGPGASQSGSKQITVPLSTALGTYYALACADDKKKVKETSEANNSSGVEQYDGDHYSLIERKPNP